MSTHQVFDNYGDALNITFENDSLEIQANDGALEDFYFTGEALEDIKEALSDILGSTDDEPAPSPVTDPNEAKLRLAVQFNLRARFSYTDGFGNAGDRRLEPSLVWEHGDFTYVGGESFDEDGDAEGYRNFRLDRIDGPVAVR